MSKRKNCNPQPKHKKQPTAHKNISVKSNNKRKSKKLTAAEFADMNQIDWVPFDPYGD